MAETVIQKKRLQAINLFVGAIKNLRFYPPASEVAIGSVDRAYASLVETIEEAGPVVFTVSNDDLSVSACPFTEKEQQFPHIRSMVEMMTYWNIRTLILESELERDELVRFLLDFKRIPDEIEAVGGLRKLLPTLVAPHIRIESRYLLGDSRQSRESKDEVKDAFKSTLTADRDETIREKTKLEEMVDEGLTALAEGKKDLFADRDFFSLIPEIVMDRIHTENIEGAMALLEKVSAGLETPKPDIQDIAAEILVLTGNRLASDNRLEEILVVAPHLTRWCRSQTVLTPTSKAACRQLQLLTAHLIQNRRFEKCLPFLETLHFLVTRTDLTDDLSTFANDMLKSLAEKEAVNILSDAMMINPPPESDQAARCLVLLGPYSGQRMLELLSGASDRSERIRVMAVITEIGRQILPMIMEKIDKGGPWYFLRNLISLLGKLGDETHLKTLTPLLDHEDIRVRREALNTLYNIGGNQRKSLLLSALGNADEQLKASIVIMLGGLRHPEAIGPFLEILRNRPLIPSQNRIRLEEAICKALGRIGDPKALPALQEIIEPKGIKRITPYSESVQSAAKEAIEATEKSRSWDEEGQTIGAQADSASAGASVSGANGISDALRQVDLYIQRGDKPEALSMLSHLVENAARAKQFQAAEDYLEKMSEVDPMALSEIYKAGEFVEAEKRASLDKDRMVSWGGLYDTLTQEETHAFYFALKERRLEGNVTLIQQGQKNDALFFIEQGELKVVFEKNQREYLLKHIKAGDVAGVEAFFNPTNSTVSVITQTASQISALDLESLHQCKEKTPALENKLRDFCENRDNIARILLDKSMDRRLYARFRVEGIITLQLLHASGKLAGKAFKGRLTDLSTGGLCFFIKLQNKESARMLLGRNLQMQFPLAPKRPEALHQSTGTVVAVHYHLSIDYSVHVRFDTPMDATTLKKFDHQGQG